MRLQLGITLLLLAFSSSAHGENEGAARYLLYVDDDATTVSTTLLDIDADVRDDIAIGARVVIDAVSSASVDVVSAATKRWTETRVEVGGHVGATAFDTDLACSYTHSQENDWASQSMLLSAGRDFFQRNLRLEATYALIQNDIGRAEDPNFVRSLVVHSGEVALAQLIDPRTRVGLSVSVQSLDGYQASPYRFIASEMGARSPELHPETRERGAVSGYALRSVNRWLTMRIMHRYYRDSWGIDSHTIAVTARLDLSRSVFLAIVSRYYRQHAADFYRQQYTEARKYMSADRELSRFWDFGASTSVGAKLGSMLLDVKFGLTHYRFQNFRALPSRLALTLGGGATLPW